MKTKLLLILVLITQITLAQQVTLMQPALRDSDKNLTQLNYYYQSSSMEDEVFYANYIFGNYDEEKNPTIFLLDFFDEDNNIISQGRGSYEFYSIDNFNDAYLNVLFPEHVYQGDWLDMDSNVWYNSIHTKSINNYRNSLSSDTETQMNVEDIEYDYDTNFNLEHAYKTEAIIENDYVIERNIYSWDSETTSLNLNYIEKYYNTLIDDVLTERVVKRVYDFNTNTENNYSKEIFTETTTSLKVLFQQWNTTTNTWNDNNKRITTFNADGKVILFTNSKWLTTTSEWELIYSSELFYNVDGYINHKIISYPQDNETIDNTYTYDEQNLLTEMFVDYGDSNFTERFIFQYEPETASINETNTSIINIYPNPTNKILNIDLEENFEYQIYSIQGKLLKDGVANKQIQVSDLEKGIYFIHIKTANLEEKQKFVVN